MIRISTISWIVLAIYTIIGCSVSQSNMATKKLSIKEKLQENNNLSVEERIALYHRLKKKKTTTYFFEKETELAQYGQSLLDNDLIEEAIEIFKLNSKQFPNSPKVYDNLSKAYMYRFDKARQLSSLNREKAIALWSILETDSTWGTEIFHFPIKFAKEINFEGIEDARFPKGWSDTKNDNFWTYAYGWNINLNTKPTVSQLQKYMQLYFDGLMTSIHNENDAPMTKTIAKFETMNSNSNDDFAGTVNIFDGFTTKKPLVLNVLVDYNYCEKKKTSQILFKFSPKKFEHQVWEKLNAIKFKESVCE